MNFIPTIYAYPLREPILISRHINAVLDNPRTDEEIAALKRHIEISYILPGPFQFPTHSDDPILTLERLLLGYATSLTSHDEYVRLYYETYDPNEIYDFIAKMWVIARYDDLGESEDLRNRKEELRGEGLTDFFFLLDDSNPIIANAKRLVHYSYLLSLFINTQNNYDGSSFIANHETYSFDPSEPYKYIPLFILNYGIGLRNYPNSDDETRWQFLPYVIDNIQYYVDLLDNAMERGHEEKLIYIGELLKTAGERVLDPKIKLVTLVSIIELLLTHNPDFNRFNVEDSISKQFRLKASILVYLHDRKQDLGKIKSRLKIIYDMRSSIAHGNFKAVEKYNQKLSEQKGQEEHFDDMLDDIYKYIRIILHEFIVDPTFVDFLKEN